MFSIRHPRGFSSMARCSRSSPPPIRFTCCRIRCCGSCCGCHAFDLPDPRGRPRKHSRARRRAARLQPHVVRRRAAAVASTDRPIRFLMYKGIYDLPYVKPFAKLMGAIPISSEQRPREMIHSLRAASDAIREGEDRLHFRRRTDHAHRPDASLPPRHGAHHEGRRRADHPVNLDGVWGSIFSFERGRFLWKMPRSIPYPVTVSFGKPMPPTATPFEVRQRRAGVAERGVHPPQEAHAHAAPLPDSHRAPHSLPLRHGRPAPAAHELGRRAAERDFPRAPAEQHLAGPGNGRHSAAAFGAGRAGEFRGDAGGQSSGESELHDLERSAGIVRRAVQARNGHHHEGAARAHSAESPRQDDPARRGGRRLAPRRKNRRAAALVPSGRVARARAERQASRTRRSRHHNFFERQHRRAQRRDAVALQHRVQHRADGPDVHVRQQRQPARRAAVLPFLRLHGHAVAARSSRRGVVYHPSPLDLTAIGELVRDYQRDIPARDADVSASVHAALLARGFRQPAIS